MKGWFLTVIVVVIAALGGGVFPTWKANKALKAEIETLNKTLEEKITDLKSLEEQQVKQKEKQQNIAQRIPVELDQGEVIRDVQNLAVKTGFVFDSLRFSKGVHGSTQVPKLSVQFQVRGKGDRLLSLLTALENNDPFLGLTSLNVIREENKEMVLNVDLYTFSLR